MCSRVICITHCNIVTVVMQCEPSTGAFHAENSRWDAALLVDGRGQRGGCVHPSSLSFTRHRPRDMPTGWYDCSMSTDTALMHPLIQPEHPATSFVWDPKCQRRRKKGSFYAELWVPVPVDRIFNRNRPKQALKSWEWREILLTQYNCIFKHEKESEES